MADAGADATRIAALEATVLAQQKAMEAMMAAHAAHKVVDAHARAVNNFKTEVEKARAAITIAYADKLEQSELGLRGELCAAVLDQLAQLLASMSTHPGNEPLELTAEARSGALAAATLVAQQLGAIRAQLRHGSGREVSLGVAQAFVAVYVAKTSQQLNPDHTSADGQVAPLLLADADIAAAVQKVVPKSNTEAFVAQAVAASQGGATGSKTAGRAADKGARNKPAGTRQPQSPFQQVEAPGAPPPAPGPPSAPPSKRRFGTP